MEAQAFSNRVIEISKRRNFIEFSI